MKNTHEPTEPAPALTITIDKKRWDFLIEEMHRLSVRYNLRDLTEEEVVRALIDRHRYLTQEAGGASDVLISYYLTKK